MEFVFIQGKHPKQRSNHIRNGADDKEGGSEVREKAVEISNFTYEAQLPKNLATDH